MPYPGHDQNHITLIFFPLPITLHRTPSETLKLGITQKQPATIPFQPSPCHVRYISLKSALSSDLHLACENITTVITRKQFRTGVLFGVYQYSEDILQATPPRALLHCVLRGQSCVWGYFALFQSPVAPKVILVSMIQNPLLLKNVLQCVSLRRFCSLILCPIVAQQRPLHHVDRHGHLVLCSSLTLQREEHVRLCNRPAISHK
jgi:hypothetical protein